MTEAEWLTCTRLNPMLDYLGAFAPESNTHPNESAVTLQPPGMRLLLLEGVCDRKSRVSGKCHRREGRISRTDSGKQRWTGNRGVADVVQTPVLVGNRGTQGTAAKTP